LSPSTILITLMAVGSVSVRASVRNVCQQHSYIISVSFWSSITQLKDALQLIWDGCRRSRLTMLSWTSERDSLIAPSQGQYRGNSTPERQTGVSVLLVYQLINIVRCSVPVITNRNETSSRSHNKTTIFLLLLNSYNNFMWLTKPKDVGLPIPQIWKSCGWHLDFPLIFITTAEVMLSSALVCLFVCLFVY